MGILVFCVGVTLSWWIMVFSLEKLDCNGILANLVVFWLEKLDCNGILANLVFCVVFWNSGF
jgi:hypothetical protein